jgi:hypothetical protein
MNDTYDCLLALLTRARLDLIEAVQVSDELTRDGCMSGRECRNMGTVVTYLAGVERQVLRRSMDARQEFQAPLTS